MKHQTPTPPRLATYFIEQLGDQKEVSNILGDLYELYLRRLTHYGKKRAALLYWRDAFSVLLYHPVKRKKSTYSTSGNMKLFGNYFKVGLRNLFRQKAHVAINTVGLSVGIAFSVLIFLYVAHELSYDKFHKRADRIYLLPMTWHFNGTDVSTGGNCSAGGPFMAETFPEVEESVRMYMSTLTFLKEGEPIKEKDVYFADSAFFKIFTFPLLAGDFKTALTRPYSIVITRRMAEKYFGSQWQNQSLIGRQITTTNNKIYQIAGIAENPPTNSHLQFSCVASFVTLPVSRQKPSWDSSEFFTYLLLHEKADPQSLVKIIPAELERKFSKQTAAVIELDLVPLEQIYLNNLSYSVPGTSNMLYVRIFSFTALLVLLIAIINYINLSTARSIERALEVGVRKVMGAQRVQLFYQFLSESLIITSVSLILAFSLAKLALPYFNIFTEKTLNFASLVTIKNVFIVILMSIGISLLAGLYPALFMSGYHPVKVLKGKLKDSLQGIKIRKALVVGQFLISMVLIICTLTVSKQISFLQSKNLGYEKGKLVSLSLDSLSRTRLDVLEDLLRQHSKVENVSYTYQSPVLISHQTALSLKNQSEDERKLMNAVSVDSDFQRTAGLEIIAGTSFTPNIEKTSDTWEIIINESAAKFFGWTPQESVGRELNVWQTDGVIKGVVKDFHFASLHNPIAPLVLFSGRGASRYSTMLVKTSGSPEEINEMLQAAWKKINADSPFILNFLDEQYMSLYKKETQLTNIINVFACLAVFISVLGLFGLASYAVLQRTRELGIRKVLGASITQLMNLISGSFLKLVLVAFILAAPVSWYLMTHWLSNFAYHISFNWLIVIVSGFVTLSLALFTVLYHAFEVTRINPSETLRNN